MGKEEDQRLKYAKKLFKWPRGIPHAWWGGLYRAPLGF